MSRKKRLVLIGGGHAHVFVLRAFGRQPMPDVELTLIAKELQAPYSGMLPGFVAGHYSLDECQIDLERLGAFAGARVMGAAATGIDRRARTVTVAGHEPVPYDVLSIDAGITPDVGGIPGAIENALVVKPVSEFAPKWQVLEARVKAGGGPRHVVAVGGGAAGVELILAARHKLARLRTVRNGQSEPVRYALVTSGRILPGHSARAQRLARQALTEANVAVIENERVVGIATDHVRLRSGTQLPCDTALVSTRARAPAWFAGSGLARDAGGFLALKPTLQCLNDDDVFAAGDCATVIEHPRPKAGVFAVRQGPVLACHLRRHLNWQVLDPFVPQTHYLTLISLGARKAIADRNGMATGGAWVWHWKDWIDRRFMSGFTNL